MFIIFCFLCAELPAAVTATGPDCCTRCVNFGATVYNLLLGEEHAAGPAAGHTHRPTVAGIAAAAEGERNTMSSLYSNVAVPALPHGRKEEMAGSVVGFRPEHPLSTGADRPRTPAAPALPKVASVGPGSVIFMERRTVPFTGEAKEPVPDIGRVVGADVNMSDLAPASGFSAASGRSPTGLGFLHPGVQALSSGGDIPTADPTLPGTALDGPPPTGEGK